MLVFLPRNKMNNNNSYYYLLKYFYIVHNRALSDKVLCINKLKLSKCHYLTYSVILTQIKETVKIG